MLTAASAAAAMDVPCRVLLGRRQAEQVAGEREESIRRIRAESGANVQVLDRTLPSAFHARDECLVVIKADDGAGLRAALAGTFRLAFADPGDEERQRNVEVMIPEVACRHLVGARGDRIKLLREEAGCDVQLAHGAVAGVAAQRRVRCGGRLPALCEAVARVHEVLVEFASIGILHPRHFDLQEVVGVSTGAPGAALRDGVGPSSRNSRVPVRLLVSKDECGWMIGKRGNKIHKLRELTLVSTRDADAELQELGSDSVVDIFGAPLAKELCVLQLIVDDLAMMREALPATRLVLAAEFGAAVRPRLDGIRTDSAASAVRLRERGAWCVVELEGGERERLHAARLLHELLEEEAAARDSGAVRSSRVAVDSRGAEASAPSQLTPLPQPQQSALERRRERRRELEQERGGERVRELEEQQMREREREREQQRQQQEQHQRQQQQREQQQQQQQREQQQREQQQREQQQREQQQREQQQQQREQQQQQQQQHALRQQQPLSPSQLPPVRPQPSLQAPRPASEMFLEPPIEQLHQQQQMQLLQQQQRQAKGDASEWPALRLLLPASDGRCVLAQRLSAEEGFCLASRAGVSIWVEPGQVPTPCGAASVLAIRGPPASIAVACLLVQKAMWLDRAMLPC